MTFEEAKAKRDELERAATECSTKLDYPRNSMGLTSDEVKLSPEYQTAKASYDAAFAKLRAFNGWYVKAFKKEIREERNSRKHP